MSTSASISAPLAYKNRLSRWNRVARILWGLAWVVLYRPSPRPLFFWRRGLLRCFGAEIGRNAHPYPSCRIWAPWNLRMAEDSCLADGVDCYCVAQIVLGVSAIVSQGSMLCTATHDFNDPEFKLVTRAISIGDQAWIGARAFIGPGVSIGNGAVVGAASAVFRDVPEWTVVGGNPAKPIKERRICPKN